MTPMTVGECIDCRRRRGVPRGFAAVLICDPCWLLRCRFGAPRGRRREVSRGK